MNDAGSRVRYEFDGFQLDTQQRLLLSGADRRPVPLTPRVFDTLLYMVERHGELLDKSTLLKAIWPNVIVEENNLNQNISVLRRALGENPGEHRYIVTEPGRGYRFVADVRLATHAPPASQAETAANAQSPGKSVAVLPFANLTGDPGKDYFGDGIAEELIHKLTRMPSLRVPARTSSFAYRGRNVDVREIARDLNVGVLLEGSVRSAGERVRITAQLVNGQDGFHLWSNSYDRKFEDLFELQDDIAQAIANALRVTLDGAAAAAGAHRPTRNLEAYHLFLQATARHGSAGVNPTNVEAAYAMYQRAIELDPGFARAYNQMADVRAIGAIVGAKLPGTLADVETAVSKALSLDPTLGGAHAAVGVVNALQGKWVDAEERFQRAFEEDPDDPSSRQAYGFALLGTVGHLQRYYDSTAVAHRLAPAWFPVLLNGAATSLLIHCDDEARANVQLARNLGATYQVGPLPDISATLEMRAGRVGGAVSAHVEGLLPQYLALGGEETVRAVYAGIQDPARRDAACAALDDFHARCTTAGFFEIMNRRMMYWYVQLGALERAYALFEESLERMAQVDMLGAAWSFLWLREMQALRDDARFEGVIERFGFMPYWERFGPPDGHELRRGKLVSS